MPKLLPFKPKTRKQMARESAKYLFCCLEELCDAIENETEDDDKEELRKLLLDVAHSKTNGFASHRESFKKICKIIAHDL